MIFNCNVGFFQKQNEINEVVWDLKHHPTKVKKSNFLLKFNLFRNYWFHLMLMLLYVFGKLQVQMIIYKL